MLLTISTNAEPKPPNRNTMKCTLIAITAFAALLSTGYAENLRNADANLDDVPTAAIMDDTQGGMMKPLLVDHEENAGKKRTLGVKEEDDHATKEHAPQMTSTTNKAETGGTRALGTMGTSSGNKKDYSGQSCSLCCDDDYHC
jgi:hypothetical protein